MNNEELNILTSYIAAWGWQLLSFICFGTGVVLIVTSNTMASIVFGTGFIMCFVGSQYMSHKRKGEVYDG